MSAKREGIYRAIVVDADDPQQRGRVRVFVYGVNRLPNVGGQHVRHQVSYYDIVTNDLFLNGVLPCVEGSSDTNNDISITPSETRSSDGDTNRWLSLPWAERADHQGGHLYGNFAPVLIPGSIVWVMFEQGDEVLPVVVGSGVANAGDGNGFPGDLTGDYAWGKFRHLCVDSMGSGLVASADPRDGMARLTSGNAWIEASGAKQSVQVSAPEGVFRVDTMSISLWSEQQAFLTGEEVTIHAIGRPLPRGDGELLAEHLQRDQAKKDELQGDKDQADADLDAVNANPDATAKQITSAQTAVTDANSAIDDYNARAGGFEDSETTLELGTRLGLFSSDTAILYGEVETFIGQYGKYTGSVVQSDRVYVAPKYVQIGSAMPVNTRAVYGGKLKDTLAVHIEASRKAITFVRDSDTDDGVVKVGTYSGSGIHDPARSCHTGPWAGMISGNHIAIAGDGSMIIGQAAFMIGDYCEGGLSERDHQPPTAQEGGTNARARYYQNTNCGIWPENLMLGRHITRDRYTYADEVRPPPEGPGIQRSALTCWNGSYDELSQIQPTTRVEAWATSAMAFVTDGAAQDVCGVSAADSENADPPAEGSEAEALAVCGTCAPVPHVKDLGNGAILVHAAGHLTLASNVGVTICAPSVDICNQSNFPVVACGTGDDGNGEAWIAAMVMNGHPCPDDDGQGNLSDPRTGEALTENADGTVVGEDGKPFCVTYIQHVGPNTVTVIEDLTYAILGEDGAGSYAGDGSGSGSASEGATGGVALRLYCPQLGYDFRGHYVRQLQPGSYQGNGEEGEASFIGDPCSEVLIPQFLVDLGDIPAPQAGSFLQATGPNTFVWTPINGGGGGSTAVFGDLGAKAPAGVARGGAVWIQATDNNGAIEIHHVGPDSVTASTVTIKLDGAVVGSIPFDQRGHYNAADREVLITSGGLAPHALTTHTDVTIAGPAEGHGLYYDNGTGQWVNFDRDVVSEPDLTVVGGDELVDFTIETSSIRISYRPVTITITRNKLNGAVAATRSVGTTETLDLTRGSC